MHVGAKQKGDETMNGVTIVLPWLLVYSLLVLGGILVGIIVMILLGVAVARKQAPKG